MGKSKFRSKGKWTACAGGVTMLIGGWWLTRELQMINEKLNQAHPIRIMTGEREAASYIYLPKTAEWIGSPLQWEDLAPSHPPAGVRNAWQPDFSRTPWELVGLARSDDKDRRLFGLKLLASLKNLHVSFCHQIAQASDRRMAVGLATTQAANLNMLLPPPHTPPCLATTSVEQDFRLLLESLPRENVPKCLHYLTTMGLQERSLSSQPDIIADPWWSEGSSRLKPSQMTSRRSFGTAMLEALLAHSTVANHKKEIVRLKGLPILLKFYLNMPEVGDHKRMIAQVIGNIALDVDCHDQIFQAGWIRVLAEWSRSNDLEVALPASRALANLAAADSNCPTWEDGLFIAHPLHWETDVKTLGDVVFVHGLLGGAFKTWRQDDHSTGQDSGPDDNSKESKYTFCWPKDWLARDCPHLRVLLVDYDTQLTEWGRRCPFEDERKSLEGRSQEFLRKLHKAGVGKRPTVWVTHSMGGLLVKKMLLLSKASTDPEIQRISQNTRGVVFYSVPHRGCQLATFHFGSQYLLSPSPEVRQLRPGSRKLEELHADFMELVCSSPGIQCLSFCEMQKTTLGNLHLTVTFVSKESAAIDIGDSYHVPTDHVYICKPSDQESPIYRHLASFVRACIDHSTLENLEHPSTSYLAPARLQTDYEFILGASFI